MCEDHICSGPYGSGAMIPQIASNGEITGYASCAGDKLPNGAILLEEEVITGWDNGAQRESVVLCVTSGVQPFVTWYRVIRTTKDHEGRPMAQDFCETGHYASDLLAARMEYCNRIDREIDRVKTPPTTWETACEAVRETYRTQVGDELEQDPADWHWEEIYTDENPVFSTVVFGALEYVGVGGGGTTYFSAFMNQPKSGGRWVMRHLTQYIDGEPMLTEYENGKIAAIR